MRREVGRRKDAARGNHRRRARNRSVSAAEVDEFVLVIDEVAAVMAVMRVFVAVHAAVIAMQAGPVVMTDAMIVDEVGDHFDGRPAKRSQQHERRTE